MKSLQQFDLNLLLILDALISECHVSRAAERVHLSQSAMSHALNRLRNQLDDPILVRSGKGLTPTPRANEMLPQVRHIIGLLEHTLAPQKPFVPASSQRVFTIACTDYFEMEFFPRLLQQIQQDAPEVVLELEMITEKTINHGLENKEVDLVVGIDSSQSVPAHLVKQHWHSQTFACLAGRTNRQVSKQLSLAQYCSLKHITFLDVTGSAASVIDKWLSEQQLSRLHIARAVNYTAAAKATIATEGVMTLPLNMANSFCEMFDLELLIPPKGIPMIEMSMLHHPLFSNDQALTWLIAQIKAL